MSRRIVLVALAMLVSVPSMISALAGAGSVTGTDPNDVPKGDADILETTKRRFTTPAGIRKVSFRVRFEEPAGDAYSLVRVSIDTRRGPRADFLIQVDVMKETQNENCWLWELRKADEPKICRLFASTDPPDATSWRVPLRRRVLAPTKRIRWSVHTDSDFGSPDNAPDSGWYT